VTILPFSPTSAPHDPAAPSWAEHLARRLESNWRPSEWDPVRLRFTFNPDLDETMGRWCETGCGRMSYSIAYCTTCARDVSRKPVTKRYAADLDYESTRCVIANSDYRCEGRAMAEGLCSLHHQTFINSQRRPLDEWLATTTATPRKNVICKVRDCFQEINKYSSRGAHLSHALCAYHVVEYEAEKATLPYESWAQTAEPRFPMGTVSLASLHETFRNELLFALQADDRQGLRCYPATVASIVKMARREHIASMLDPAWSPEAFATYPTGRRVNLNHQGKGRRWLNNLLQEHSSFTGTDLTAADIWDVSLVGLPHASEKKAVTRMPVSLPLDFTGIRQSWLREITKAYIRDVLPRRNEARQTVRGMTFLSAVMAARGESDDPTTARLSDITRAVAAINAATHTNRDGQSVPYSVIIRMRFLSGVRNVLAHGRSQGLMEGVPSGFTFNRHHKIATTKTGPARRSVPHRAIAQLIDALPRFVTTMQAHGCVLSPQDHTLLLRTALRVQIDTGRRGGEVRSLFRDCLRVHTGENGAVYSLVYDNHKAGRKERVIPILPETAEAILGWRTHLATLPIPRSAEPWLFPSLSAGRSGGSGRLTDTAFADALDSLVELASPLDSDVPDPNSPTGYALFTERITPHMFRHSYAQRLADAGVAIDAVSELLDHLSLDTTKGYYAVSDERKRKAISLVSTFIANRFGQVGASASAGDMYPIQTVAVPFGNCAEPSNVKAGGQACPIKFRCSGCDHFRPDPSHLPVLREHLTELRANLALVEAGGFAADWVVESAREEIDAYKAIIQGLDDAIAALPPEDRHSVEDAAGILHNARTGDARTLIPITPI
jgi:integrase